MEKILTVRRLIWLWQCLEFFLLYWIWRQFHDGVLAISVLTLFTMVSLRLLLMGVHVSVIAHMSATSKMSIKSFMCFCFNEFLSFCYLYFWWQAKPRTLFMREPVVRDKHVILVHGFFCNDGFWFQLAPKLLSDGYSVTGVEMSSVFSSIDQFTVLLEQEIGRCLAENSMAEITVVSFSMGGLAARNLPSDVQQKIHLITLYTPHGGTKLASIISLFGAKNGKQMSAGSFWTYSCNSQPSNFIDAVGIWSEHDTIVVPSFNAVPPFHALRLHGRGHLSAAIDGKLHRHILRLLKCFHHGYPTSIL